MRGLYIIHPHAELIRSGSKVAIVKSRKLDIGNEPLYLISKKEGQGYNYGKILLSDPIKIDLDDFKRLESQHKITEQERKEWCKKQKSWCKAPLYFYKILKLDLYKIPKKIKIPRGIQTTMLSLVDLQFIPPLKPYVNTDIPESNEFFTINEIKDFNLDNYIIEPKYDGLRIQLHKIGDRVNGFTSYGNRIPKTRIGLILDELEKQNAYSLILDGELYLPGEDANEVFLSITERDQNPNLIVKVFDILHFDGKDLTDIPLSKRREILEEIFTPQEHLQLSEPLEIEDFENLKKQFFELIKKTEIEGLVLKKKSSIYKPSENKKWFKVVAIEKYLPSTTIDLMDDNELRRSRIVFNRLKRKLQEGKEIPVDEEEVESWLEKIENELENRSKDFGLPFEKINRDTVGELSQNVLLGLHFRTHQHFKRLMGYGHKSGKSLAEVINAHYWLAKEMVRRNLRHSIHDRLDVLSLRFRGFMNPTDTISFQEFIKDIKYDPTKVSNKVLADDLRIAFAWYATVRRGKKFKYTKDQIINLATVIFKEMKKRGFKFHPEKMKKYSKELYEIIQKRLKQDFSKYLPIYPGGNSERGEEIKLKQLIDKLKEFKLIEDFVTIVGSLTNWRKTTGDIDVLIKAPEDSDIFQLVKWRFIRAFPEYADRFHFVEYGMWQGPFTPHCHVFDLKAVFSESFPEVHEMARIFAKDYPNFDELAKESKKEDSVKLFRPHYLLKPMHGRQKGEIYSIDSVLRTINAYWKNWKDVGVFVEKKHDGVHCMVMKRGDEVKIVSEDGADYTENCPTLVKEFQSQPGNFHVIGEIEYWKEGKHQPRAETAGILNAKEVRPEEKDLRINLFDCTFYQGNT